MTYVSTLPVNLNPFIELAQEPKAPPTIYEILDTVSQYMEVPKLMILSKDRRAFIVDARMITAYIAYQTGIYTLKQIGWFLNRDHSSIVYSLQACKGHIQFDKSFRAKVEAIEAILKAN